MTLTDTFTHDGHEYDLRTARRIAKTKPILVLSVNDLIWVLNHDTPNMEHVPTVDLNEPLFVVKWKGKWAVVDGLHRLQKAVNIGKTALSCKVFDKEDLKQCRIP